MKSRSYRAMLASAAAGLMLLPILAVAAPKKPAPKKPAPKPPAKGGDAKAGLAAFTKEGCSGCHITKEVKGGPAGPDLSTIGATKKGPEISAYIAKPKSGSIMPAFKGPKKTLDDLTAYMLTQK